MGPLSLLTKSAREAPLAIALPPPSPSNSLVSKNPRTSASSVVYRCGMIIADDIEYTKIAYSCIAVGVPHLLVVVILPFCLLGFLFGSTRLRDQVLLILPSLEGDSSFFLLINGSSSILLIEVALVPWRPSLSGRGSDKLDWSGLSWSTSLRIFTVESLMPWEL